MKDNVLVQAQIERTLEQVLAAMEDATEEYAALSDRSAEADVTFKVSFAKARLVSEQKTVAEREDEATVQTEREALSYKIAESRAKAQKEYLNTLRARSDGLRSLLASVRGQT